MSRFIITLKDEDYAVYEINAATPEEAVKGAKVHVNLISAVSIDEGKAWQFVAGKWEELA
jgi:hypothetical protein